MLDFYFHAKLFWRIKYYFFFDMNDLSVVRCPFVYWSWPVPPTSPMQSDGHWWRWWDFEAFNSIRLDFSTSTHTTHTFLVRLWKNIRYLVVIMWHFFELGRTFTLVELSKQFCVYGMNGACNYYGHVRYVSRFIFLCQCVGYIMSHIW